MSQIASGASLSFVHAFGIRPNLRDGVTFIGESAVLYAVGRHIAIYNLETRTMKFLQKKTNVENVTSLAVTENRKYACLCESCEAPASGGPRMAQASIVYLPTPKRVRTVTFQSESDFVAAAFSRDSKFLVTVTGEPDYCVVFWQWERERILGSYKLGSAVSRITINPYDNHTIAVSGKLTLKVLKLADGAFRPMEVIVRRYELQNYTDHCWVSNTKWVTTCENGDIIIADHTGDLKHTIRSVHPGGVRLECILPCHRGFAVAGAGGYLSSFEKQEEGPGSKEPFIRINTVKNDDGHSILSMSLPPSEKTIACITSNSQLLSFPWRSIGEKLNEDNKFTPLTMGFHSGAVTGMSVCSQRPLIFTTGEDRTLRIWNYLEQNCELVHTFFEDPVCVAANPWGFQIVVAFTSKIVVYNVLADEIRVFHEFQHKHCKDVRFSNGGHMFAVLSGAVIVIYSSTTFNVEGTLKGHATPVKACCWSQDDHYLVTVASDGALYVWNVAKMERQEEIFSKNLAYTCVGLTKDTSRVITSTTDKKLRESPGLKTTASTRELKELNDIVYQLLMSNSYNIMFTGSERGNLGVYSYPYETQNFREYQVHIDMVTRIAISSDDNFLFSAGDDGSIFIYDVQPIEKGQEIPKKPVQRGNYTDMTMVSKVTMDEKLTMIHEFKNTIANLKTETDYKLALKEQEWERKYKARENEMMSKLRSSKTKFDSLKQRFDQTEVRNMEEMERITMDHSKQMEVLENKYQRQLADEMDKNDTLQEEKEDLIFQFEERLILQGEKHKAATNKVKHEFDKKMKDKEQQNSHLLEDYTFMETRYKTQINQQEVENELEVSSFKEKAKLDLENERQKNSSLTGELDYEREKYMSLREEYHDAQTALKNRESDVERLNKHVENAEKTIMSLRKEVQKREDTIAIKEKQICELWDRIAELEKFRECLWMKIKDQEKSIEPQLATLERLREQITVMDKEREEDHKKDAGREHLISNQAEKIHSMQEEIMRMTDKMSTKQRLIDRFLADLRRLAIGTDPTQMVNGVKTMFQMYCDGSLEQLGERVQEEDEAFLEVARQRDYMENKVNRLKALVIHSDNLKKVAIKESVAESMVLVDEMNSMRRENAELKRVVREMKGVIHSMQAADRIKDKPQRESPSPLSLGSLNQAPGSATPTQMRSASPSMRSTLDSRQSMPLGTPNVQRTAIMDILSELDDNMRDMENQNADIKQLREQVQHLVSQTSHLMTAAHKNTQEPNPNLFPKFRSPSPLPGNIKKAVRPTVTPGQVQIQKHHTSSPIPPSLNELKATAKKLPGTGMR